MVILFKKGFVFSLDAFIAFILAMSIIYSMLLLISVPAGYYQEFEQTYLIAKDAGKVMRLARYEGDTNRTLMQQMIGDIESEVSIGNICDQMRGIIPGQYAFQIDYFDESLATPDWAPYCDTESEFDDTYDCSEYRKIKVSTPLLITDYAFEPEFGESPFCYINCGVHSFGSNCTMTPCSEPIPDITPGDIYTGMMRITICV